MAGLRGLAEVDNQRVANLFLAEGPHVLVAFVGEEEGNCDCSQVGGRPGWGVVGWEVGNLRVVEGLVVEGLGVGKRADGRALHMKGA